jgi:uncharacterized iron-regulated membrane protein
MKLATIRQWHSYIGVFIAPSVLYFALTGAAQIFNLHEAHGTYHPPVLLEKLSAVHKDQVFARPHDEKDDRDTQNRQGGASPAPTAAQGPPEGDDDEVSTPTLLLKWFFALVATGLVVSSSLGIWMGLTQIRPKRTAAILLAAGTLTPIVLLLS